jgi:TonB family protein
MNHRIRDPRSAISDQGLVIRSATAVSCLMTLVIATTPSLSVFGQTDNASDFTPARWLSGSTPSLPSPNTIGSIGESVELAVDASGHVQVIAARATSGSSLLSSSVADWRFRPAIESGAAVASHVLVAAIYRAPELYNTSATTSPVDLAERSRDIPFPTVTVPPVYPPRAVADAVAIVEVLVGVDGRVRAARIVNSAPGFESAALTAARAWSFQPAQRGGQRVSAYAYLVFGFRKIVNH